MGKKPRKKQKVGKKFLKTSKDAKSEKSEDKIQSKNKVIRNVLIAATIILIMLIFATIALNSDNTKLKDNNAKVITALKSSGTGLSVLKGNVVDSKKISELDYEQLKKEYDINSDFAIYFEDENHNIVTIEGNTCFGSPDIVVNGIACKSK